MRILTVRTSRGPVIFDYRGWDASSAPMAVVFHGFGRTSANLLPLQDMLPYDLVFARMPGYGSDLIAPRMDNWIDAFREAIGAFPKRPVLTIGESLGALIALGQGLPCIALDPFLRTQDLWVIDRAVEIGRSKGLLVYEELVDGMFRGVDHHPLLERITAPTLVVAGNRLLAQDRSSTTGSLLSLEDEAAFAAHQLVEIKRVDGGHLVLADNTATCLQLIQDHGARHAPWSASQQA